MRPDEQDSATSHSPIPRSSPGADVGASRLKLALVDHAGRVLRSSEQPTPRTGTGVQIAAEIADSIAAFSADTPGGVESVGVGVVMPHFVEGPEFIQRWPNNLPALEGVAMRPLLRARLGERVAMANDVSAAAVAEHMFGVGRGIDRLVVVSIGTGISIGVVIEGELLQYTWGTAGDTGHVIVDTGGEAALHLRCARLSRDRGLWSWHPRRGAPST